MGNKERNTSSSRCSTGCRYIVAACPSMDSRKQGLPKTELHLIWQSGGSWRGQRYIALFACACVKDPAATTTTTTFVPTHAAGPNLLCGRPRRFIRERKRCCKGLHDTRDVGGRKKRAHSGLKRESSAKVCYFTPCNFLFSFISASDVISISLLFGHPSGIKARNCINAASSYIIFNLGVVWIDEA